MKLLLVGLVFFVCGCAKIILPYEEAQLCRKGADRFLIYRVELKVNRRQKGLDKGCRFLIYRVELKVRRWI